MCECFYFVDKNTAMLNLKVTYRPVILILTLLLNLPVKAQTDTEFWFVVPEITIDHYRPGGANAFFKFSTGLLPATVTISMPANQYDPATNPTGFQDIVINMAANSFHQQDLSCWVVRRVNPAVPDCNSIPLNASYAAGDYLDVNRLENKPLNASGINKFGIHITATNPITSYWEISRQNNKEIWALKGKNALGTDFYTPFQTHGANQNVIADTPSAIDVVATEDNTVVTFQLPVGISASYGNPMTTVPAGGTLNRTLMAGETFSLFPLNKQRTTATRLSGTRVTSTRPVAISLKDDSFVHTSGGCYDLAGDQLVPTNIIGKEYAIIRSDLNNHDHIYILGTQNTTNVTIYNTAGAVIATPTVNAGQQLYYQLPTGQTFYRVRTDKPVYVWHVGGFGCEQGGAVLPPIDICTGTTQVAFARTSTETFYIIMMVRKGAEDGFTFNGAVRNDLFPPASFVSYAGFNWSVARFGPFTNAQIPAGVSNFMNNTKDIFHLGIVNGGGGSGCYYGYFSDYNELKIQAVVAGTNSSVLKTCYGNPVQLRAFGGTNYLWSPDSTLNDAHAQLPWASPKINAKYKVVVSGACNMKDSAYIDVLVSTPLTAAFTTDKVSGCAPLTVNFEDKSTGIRYWRYDMGDGTAYRKWDNDAGTPDPAPPVPFTFSHTFNNNTNDTIDYKVVLLAKNQDGCAVVYEKIITVLPSIDANFSRNPIQGCNPLAVTFTNASSNNTADSYLWEFGDGFNQVTANPVGTLTHTYNNLVPRDSLYTVRMIATSPHGCRDTSISTVNVYSYFNADFKVNVASGCSPLTVNIDNVSVGDTARYVWRLNGTQIKTTGRDTALILTNLTDTYIDYVIQLQVYNQGDRCNQIVNRTVRVFPQLQAGFLVPQPAYCNLSSIGFTNTTSPATTNPGGIVNVYSWDFGDGANSALANPTHIYDNQTNNFKDYTITLTARNQFGCQSNATRNVRIYSQIYADFAVTPTQACSPVTVNVDNNSRGGIVAYSWDYGDATNSATNLDHSHPYTNNGLVPITRTINLTVTNEGNCTSVLSRDVLIYPSVTASFDPSVSAGCNELSVTFNNTSKANATVFNWDFGNGNSSVENSPTHTFTNSTGINAVYTVTLNVQTEYGCNATINRNITVYPFVDANFVIDTSSGCSPLDIWFNYTKHPGITEYRWDWDGGGTTDLTTLPADPSKVFYQYINQTGAVQNFTPRLTVRNHAGCEDFMAIPLSVYPEVTAAFTASDIAGCNPIDVMLSNSSYFKGTASPLINTNYYWNFGDGGSSNFSSPIHTYSNDDPVNNIVYTTWLKVVSQYGCADSISQNIEVYNRVESHFTFDYASNCTPFNVAFYPAAIGASEYNWTYGGAPGLPAESFLNGNSFTRAFTNLDPDVPATYTVTLSVENNEGCPSVLSREIEVYPVVDAVFAPSVGIGCSDLPVTFSNTSTGGNLVYLWDFGNGQSATTATKIDVLHVFTNRGSVDSTYNVKLKTINPNGCRDSLILPITVHPKVEAGFVFAQQSQCTPFNLDISNTSLNGNKYFWTTFYNGSAVTKSSNLFSHPFDNATLNDILTDTIKLVSRDSITGCSDSIKQTIVIYPRVVSQFDVDKLAGCNPLTVSFTNGSSGLASYIWDFGDGGASAETNPASRSFSHVYKDQSQVFKVKLTATNKFGCNSKDSTEITVYPLVKTDFQWNKFEGCTPLTVDLNNSSVSPLYKYRWDFGDATPKVYTEQANSHTYFNSTNTPPVVLTPTITLRTSYVNDSTCIDSMKLPIKVFPHIYPEFITNFQGCHPHNVTITNQTVSVNNSTDTYFWNLGNGVNSLDVNPVIQYINTSKTQDSIFTVKLRAVSVYGCKDSITHNIVVHPRPFASIELTGDYISCSPFPVEIQNNSIGTNLTNIYDFGDGSDSTTTSMANMNHIFRNLNSSNTEPYQIKLKTVTEFGCDDSISQTVYVYPEVIAKFNANPGWAACNPFVVTLQNTSTNAYYYRWDFDNGVTSSFPSPKHLFVNLTENDKVFNVSLSATSEFDCFHDTIQPITVWAKPNAHIALDPPLKVFPDATFDVYNQSNPAADNWTYSWTFNDNTFSNLKNPGTHTYLSWGPKSNDYKYNISLVINSPNCKDSTSSFVYLLPPNPIPFFTSNIDSACSPMEVHFINATQYAESFFWEFGDGTTSVEPEPIHTYTEPGYYTVKLTVNGDGGQRFYYKIFRVYQNPDANFQVYPVRVMLPDATVHAFNTSTSYSRCLWDMGDGFQTDERDPIHTYTKIGEFRIALWAYMEYKNINGDVVATCIDSISKFPAVWVEGSGLLKFPNAFKPNTVSNGGVYDDLDYKNEVFHPYHYGVVDYKLMIFSRWGEQVFTSTDVKVGWDGFINGKIAEQGVYMWRAIGKFTNGKTFDMKGSVTLLR